MNHTSHIFDYFLFYIFVQESHSYTVAYMLWSGYLQPTKGKAFIIVELIFTLHLSADNVLKNFMYLMHIDKTFNTSCDLPNRELSRLATQARCKLVEHRYESRLISVILPTSLPTMYSQSSKELPSVLGELDNTFRTIY